ncbi:hypothetical protein Efla_000718 [Eimeria flavescens]
MLWLQSEKNAKLAMDNALLREQNEMLMREKVKLRQNERPGKDLLLNSCTSSSKEAHIHTDSIGWKEGPRLEMPRMHSVECTRLEYNEAFDSSFCLVNSFLPPLQRTKGLQAHADLENSRHHKLPLKSLHVFRVLRWLPERLRKRAERELKMRAEISRLRALCTKQKRELLILRGADGRRVELELFLRQCLVDVKARVAGKTSSMAAPQGGGSLAPQDQKRESGELSMAARNEVLQKFFKQQQVIKLLYQIVAATNTVSELDFSWLENETIDLELPTAVPIAKSSPLAADPHGVFSSRQGNCARVVEQRRSKEDS